MSPHLSSMADTVALLMGAAFILGSLLVMWNSERKRANAGR